MSIEEVVPNFWRAEARFGFMERPHIPELLTTSKSLGCTVDLDDVRNHICELPDVIAVHDLHAWTLTSELPALSAHVVITDACLADGSAARLLDHLQHCLANHFDVEHSTFQLEAAGHADHEPGTHD